MKTLVNKMSLLLIAFVFTACANAPVVDLYAKPDWVYKPGNGVSASCGPHYKGTVAQEELAIQRAREEYAKRFGVTISAQEITTRSVANDSISNNSEGATKQVLNQTEVKGFIKEKWRDPVTSDLWVYLVPNN